MKNDTYMYTFIYIIFNFHSNISSSTSYFISDCFFH